MGRVSDNRPSKVLKCFVLVVAISLHVSIALIPGCKGKKPITSQELPKEPSVATQRLKPSPTSANSGYAGWYPVVVEIPSKLKGLAASLFKEVVRSEPVIGGGTITDIALSADHTVLAVAVDEGWVEMIDTSTGTLLYTQRVIIGSSYETTVKRVNFVGNDVLVTSGAEGTQFWKLPEFSLLKHIKDATTQSFAVDPVRGTYVYNEPTCCAIVGGDLHSQETQKICALGGLFIVHAPNRSIIAISNPSSYASWFSGGLMVWDTEEGKPIFWMHAEPREGFVYNAKGIPRLIKRYQQYETWDRKPYSVLSILTPVHIAGETVTFSPDGKWLAVSSYRGSTPLGEGIFIWVINVDSLEIKTLALHIESTISAPSKCSSIAFSLNGKLLAFSCDTEVFVWDLEANKHISTLQFPSYWGQILYIKFINDRFLIGVQEDNVISCKDIGSANLKWTYKRHMDLLKPGEWALSPTGKYVAFTDELRVGVWDIKTRRLLWVAKRIDYDRFTTLTFSPDGETLALIVEATGPKTWVLLVNAEDGRLKASYLLPEFPYRAADITTLAFSPDGNKILAVDRGSTEASLLVIDSLTGECQIFQEFVNTAFMLIPDPTRSHIVYILGENSVQAYDYQNGSLIWTRSSAMPLTLDICGEKLLVTYVDSILELLDSRTGENIASLPRPYSMTYSGKTVASGNMQGACFIDEGCQYIAILTFSALFICELYSGQAVDSYPPLQEQQVTYVYPVGSQSREIGSRVYSYEPSTSFLFYNPETLRWDRDKQLLAFSSHGHLISLIPLHQMTEISSYDDGG